MFDINPNIVEKPEGKAEIVYIPRKVTEYKKLESFIIVVIESEICQCEETKASYLQTGVNYRTTHQHSKFFACFSAVDESSFRYQLHEENDDFKEEGFISNLNNSCNLKFKVSEDDKNLTLTLPKVSIVITKNPFSISTRGWNQQLLFEQYNDDVHGAVEDRRSRFRRELNDFELSFPLMRVLPVSKCINENGDIFYVESIRIKNNEKFYGFGERFSSLNKFGTRVDNVVINPVGVTTNESYKPVPFFMSNKGYAAFYNTALPVTFHMGDKSYKAYQSFIPGEGIDIFYFCHKFPIDQLKAYTKLIGRPKYNPPLWAFGVWMGRNCYNSSEEMINVAKEIRERNLPADVLHLDWNYGVDYELDFTFDKTRFPDVPTMVKILNELGFELSIWQLPYVTKNSRLYQEIKNKDYLVFLDEKESVIDYSHPDAVRWYQKKLKGLVDLGFKAIVTDFGEAAPYQGKYMGYPGKEMHNLYPLLYAKAASEVIEEVYPANSVLWGRSAYAGSQIYPLFWGGDADSDFEGMRRSLCGGLSLGISGFPFWSHDVGGYFGKPDDEVYIRWMQFGFLSSFIRFHGTTAREPWLFGEESIRVYKKYSKLRYTLLPYIYSEATNCTIEGTPLMRFLWLDYYFDLTTENIEDEYLFGRDILVAPVFDYVEKRKVYLPQGNDWYEVETGLTYSGGSWYEIKSPIDVIPIFIKFNSAIPLTPPKENVKDINYKSITWDVFLSDGTGKTDLYWDKKVRKNTFRFTYDSSEEKLSIEFDDSTYDSVSYVVHHLNPICQVNINGIKHDFEQLSEKKLRIRSEK